MRDLLVIGAGINGAGIARDAAGRGLAVTVVEKADLAAHTSSASTKLVLLLRPCRAYGSRIECILSGARSPGDLGEHFGGGLYEAELRHLIDEEWARVPDDVLWRRTKLGLHLPDAAQRRVAQWLAAHT